MRQCLLYLLNVQKVYNGFLQYISNRLNLFFLFSPVLLFIRCVVLNSFEEVLSCVFAQRYSGLLQQLHTLLMYFSFLCKAEFQ